MAGRGRGRGRGLSINIEALGLGRGEILPQIAHPPPLFPPLPFNPGPLPQSDEMDYLVAVKQELLESFRKSPFHIKALNKSTDIARYSDKYGASIETQSPLNPDWSRLPAELRIRPPRKRSAAVLKPNLKAARKSKSTDKQADVTSLLEKLEEKDKTQDQFEDADSDGDENEKKAKEDGDDEDEIDEEYDEEDLEEQTDYNVAYFDNGENYGDDDDGDDDEPTY